MGIDNRDYLRHQPHVPWRPRVGGFSVNTWLIIVCVGVFLLDAALPRRVVEVLVLHPKYANIDRDRLVPGQPTPSNIAPEGAPPQMVMRRPVWDSTTSDQVGYYVPQRELQLQSRLSFSTGQLIFEYQFWRLIGFQFLHDHGSPMHLIFNMLGLYFFGGIVEQRLGGKRYLAFYLLCGIFGALCFMTLNVLGIIGTLFFGESFRVPFLLFHDLYAPLIGASAGVFGVMLAGAYLVPDEEVLLFYVIPMRLDRLAYGLVALSLISLGFSLSNAGGEAAHLGGAIAGAYFIRHQHHLHGFFDFAGRIDPTSRANRERRVSKAAPTALPARTVTSAGRATVARPSSDEIDRILDKIKATGLESLSAAERRTLDAAAGR